MAAGILQPFQTVTFNHWIGTTKSNHIGAIFQKAPQKASNFIVQLLAYDHGKSLDTFLSAFPTQEFESNEEYTWDVISSSRRNVPLVEARDAQGNVIDIESGNVGVGYEPFYLVFAEDWFAKGEVIWGNMNDVYPMRITDDPRYEGTNTVYKVHLHGVDGASGVPAERLLAGERFSPAYNPVEQSFSRGVGDIRFVSPVSMRNEWSTIRLKHKVGGDMLDKKLAIGLPVSRPGANGTSTVTTENVWMHYEDYQFESYFEEMKNKVLAWGVPTRNSNGEYTDFGVSGEPIKSGAGLFRQMKAGNVLYYNNFSLDLIENALLELSGTRLGMKDRVFLLRTGEWGARQLNNAINEKVSRWSQFMLDNSSLGVVKKVSSPLHDNALSAGYQFTEYRAPNGVVVQIEVDPCYDDMVQNKIMHPAGGCAFSYRYDIFYIGTMDQPNICKCAIKGKTDSRGYQWGLRNPFTGANDNFNMSYDEDSAVMHKMSTLGLYIKDPTRTMSIIPAILAA